MKINAVTSELMAEIDKRAQVEFGIPEIVLMENAGRSVYEAIASEYPSLAHERIAVFCGKGNNGGDGFVIARYLMEGKPEKLVVYIPGKGRSKEGPASANLGMIRKIGVEIKVFRDFLKDDSKNLTIGVDAVFGTGFKGELGEEYSETAAKINSLALKVFAVDIPSGLDATTGKASKNCIRAYKTITFGLPKKGFFENDGPSVSGEIVLRNIGFPGKLLDEYAQALQPGPK